VGNKRAIAAVAKRYAVKNRAKLAAYRAKRYAKLRQRIYAQIKAYRASRPGFSREVGRAYIARKLQAMPLWVDRAALRAIYAEAEQISARTAIVNCVDHIYPLQGRNSCGLHVPWNLHILPFLENCRKANKLPEEWREDRKNLGIDDPTAQDAVP
jgi:hypothetical protein